MIRATIRPGPLGFGDGEPCLHLSGRVESTQHADHVVATLVARTQAFRIIGTVLELDEHVTAAASALLVGINSNRHLGPGVVLAKPGDPLPNAGAPDIILDVSDYFTTAPIDLAAWAEPVLALGQVSPPVEHLTITTRVAPQHEQLAQASAAWRPATGGTIVVPREVMPAALRAAAMCPWPWAVVELREGAPVELEVATL